MIGVISAAAILVVSVGMFVGGVGVLYNGLLRAFQVD